MDIHTFGNTGLKKSPSDLRDFKLSKVNRLIGAVGAPPEVYSTDISKVPVLYQAKEPSCIGHATASGMMYYDEGRYSWDYSPRFLYALAKKDDGNPTSPGTNYRQCLIEGKNYGVCDNAQFSNDTSLPVNTYSDYKQIPQTAYDVAKDRKVASYVRVNDTSFQGIKNAIYQNGVVLLGVDLGVEWFTSTTGKTSWAKDDVLPLRPPKLVISGHAILAYGYDQNYIYFRNSWSTAWGDNGNGYFGPNYIPHVIEAWTFMDLTPEVVQNLKTQLSLAQQALILLQQLFYKVKGRVFSMFAKQ